MIFLLLQVDSLGLVKSYLCCCNLLVLITALFEWRCVLKINEPASVDLLLEAIQRSLQ